jgi:HSP20 family molecular chaperone IbpA
MSRKNFRKKLDIQESCHILHSNQKKGRKRDMLHSKLLDELFNPIFNTTFESSHSVNDDGNTVLEIDVPGFNKSNLRVEIADGILSVYGQTDSRKINKQYSIGNIENVEASIQDGILKLTLMEPAKRVKKIELNTPQIEDKTDDILDAVS